MQSEGLKIILSGPSGSGKGTIVKELLKDDQFVLSISVTTRKPREGEVDGVQYFFKTKEEFEAMIKDNAFLEYANFCDNYYGTPLAFIDETVKKGKDVILEIEVQGALQVKKFYEDAIFVFVMPPSFEELEHRLVGRNTETQEIIQKRLKCAMDEVLLHNEYNYVVINEDVCCAAEQIKMIVNAEKLKSHRYADYVKNMFKNQGGQ
jgi:guanylate kinase